MKIISMIFLLMLSASIAAGQTDRQKDTVFNATTSIDTLTLFSNPRFAYVSVQNLGSSSTDTVWVMRDNRTTASARMPLPKGRRYTWPGSMWKTINILGNGTISCELTIHY